MNYFYRKNGTVKRFDSLNALIYRICVDFPKMGFLHKRVISDALWDLSPGDLLEDRDLGFEVFAR